MYVGELSVGRYKSPTSYTPRVQVGEVLQQLRCFRAVVRGVLFPLYLIGVPVAGIVFSCFNERPYKQVSWLKPPIYCNNITGGTHHTNNLRGCLNMGRYMVFGSVVESHYCAPPNSREVSPTHSPLDV